MEISKREAQALAVIASRLDRKRIKRTVQPADILEVFNHLNMIQLDTISVVSRSHETALFSRLGNYNTDHLTTLFQDRQLTEYVVHAAAITPTANVPLVREMMERYARNHSDWTEERLDVRARVLDRIYAEGALSSRDFEPPADAKQLGQWESWYGNKPEREILFSLWAEGDLLVSLRDRAFGRWYDLPDRVAPHHWHLPAVTGEELQLTLLGEAMRPLGVATAPWLTDYWRTGGRAYVPNADVRKHMPVLADQGQVVPVKIEGIKEEGWLDASLLPILEELRAGSGWPSRTTFLSPFDNLIWCRPRMEQLWEMFYRLEIYTPAPKRKYGYYNMPILHRGRLVGLIDPSMNRKEGVLTVRSLHLWPNVKPTPALARAIAKSLDEFTAFLGGTDWYILQSDPQDFAQMVMQAPA
ncbi:MAG: YcaQ family DNA glycosylase [Thermomicrobiales bacterium]|nr:YcaQ family DNA glycosylase [Thermomicrobiales bacterium]